METLMNHSVVENITFHFQALSSVIPLHTICTEDDYDNAVSMLNQLLDAGATDEKHPLAGLVNTLGALISEYDNAHYPTQSVSPLKILQFLMEQHQLTQSELPEMGTQGVVSEILSGKRVLNVRQIKALSERFNVPPNVFI